MSGKTRRQRMDEFTAYHRDGDGECNGALLLAFADAHSLDMRQRWDLAYFYSAVYNIPSAIVMLGARNEIVRSPRAWAERNAARLMFQSDRRYARLNGAFPRMLEDYADHLADPAPHLAVMTSGRTMDMERAFEAVSGWFFFGRFGAFLFAETLCILLGLGARNASIDWQRGDTATSGLLNLFALDRSAAWFDRHDRLPPGIGTADCDRMLSATLGEIVRAGGDANVAKVETSLCAYRKLHKGTRYNGYYLDRQLEEIRWLGRGGPERVRLAGELLELRGMLFPSRYLGEKGGWKGVRPECKTLYMRTGRMM